jgi:hypothetical protein
MSYTHTNTRITSIDAYRGLMLFLMTLNHLILFPFIQLGSAHEFLQKYVYGPFGFFSNSEGFFFLAGLISGIVYGKSLVFKNGRDLWPRIKKRILQMYGVHLVLLFSFALVVAISSTYVDNWKALHSLIEVWKEHEGIRYFLDNPLSGFVMGALFLYFPSFFDMLPVYMLFLLCTPWVLRLLAQKKTIYVLCVSVLLWFIPQYVHENLFEKILRQYAPVKLCWFNPLAIQLLFVSGLTIGFLHVKGTLCRMQKLCVLLGASLLGMYIVLYMTNVDLESCHHLGFLRLVTFTLKALLAYLFARVYSIQAFRLLGKHSLAVFTYHVVCVYTLVFFLPEISAAVFGLQLLYLTLSVSSIWAVAYIFETRRKTAILVQPA